MARKRSRARLTRAEWSRRVERATLQARIGHVAAGRDVFSKLTAAEQMLLAIEVAETRASELCLAYKNVVMVAAGYRTRRRKGTVRFLGEPCVIFVVRNKWNSKDYGGDQLLPRYVLTHATVENQRRLCAVPTDVVAETEFHVARPNSSGVEVDAPLATSDGAVTCGVYLRIGTQPRPAVLSCQHVLTPVVPISDPRPKPASMLYAGSIASGALLGRTTQWGGQLRADGAPSFDVQLSTIENANAMAAALSPLRLSPTKPHIASLNELLSAGPNATFGLLVPKRAAVTTMFHSYLANVQGIPYPFMAADGTIREVPVHHRLLLVFRILGGDVTSYGDSGAPMVCRAPSNDGHSLIGMHIAGDVTASGAYSYVIPAWLLFLSNQYSSLPFNAVLAPITGPVAG